MPFLVQNQSLLLQIASWLDKKGRVRFEGKYRTCFNYPQSILMQVCVILLSLQKLIKLNLLLTLQGQETPFAQALGPKNSNQQLYYDHTQQH